VKVGFHKRAVKFLDKLGEKDKARIRIKLKSLIGAIEEQGVIPFKELDVKRLEGEWKGYLRMRSGNMRVILRINKQDDVLLVYEIDHRGDVYK
jgi:mRNA interferase RelE/StbE